MSNEPARGEGNQLRVILLTHGGAEDVLEGLLSLNEVNVVGVFMETEIVRRHSISKRIMRSVRYDGYLETAFKFARKIFSSDSRRTQNALTIQTRNELRRIAEDHGIPFYLVADYHAADSIKLMQSVTPELGVIYGTNIVKESVFRIPRLGSINLHQGLAPYYRGGPPVFWELYNGERSIGLTVHYVETKVDSGAIILQETVPLAYDYSYSRNYQAFLDDFCRQMRERCAQLVVEAVRLIALGMDVPTQQDPSVGKRYRLPIKAEKDELRRRLRARQRISAMSALCESKIKRSG